MPWLLLEDCLVPRACSLGVFVCTVLLLLWLKQPSTPFLKPFFLDPSTLSHGCPWVLSLSDSFIKVPQVSSGGLASSQDLKAHSVCLCCLITTENEETALNWVSSVPPRSFQRMSPSLEINIPRSLGKTLPQELLLMIKPWGSEICNFPRINTAKQVYLKMYIPLK